MKCRDATRLLNDARDRRLTRREKAAIVMHVTICTPCRRFRRDLRWLTRLARVPVRGWSERCEKIRQALRFES